MGIYNALDQVDGNLNVFIIACEYVNVGETPVHFIPTNFTSNYDPHFLARGGLQVHVHEYHDHCLYIYAVICIC